MAWIDNGIGRRIHIEYRSTSSFSFMRYPLAGGAAVAIAPGKAAPQLFTSDDQYLYLWGPFDGLKQVDKRSGAVTIILGFDPMLVLHGLAADGERVFWLTEDGCYARPQRSGPTVKLASPKVATAFAVDSSHLYWADDQGGIDCLPYEGKIWSMPKAGGEPRQLAGGQIMVVALGVDATHAYWMTEAGVLRRAAKQGGKTETLARSGREGFWPIAVGSGYGFWA